MQSMKRYKYPAMRLAFLPGLAEALFDGGIATGKAGGPPLCELLRDAHGRLDLSRWLTLRRSGSLSVVLFDMPFLLGLTMGFILKAVGPGLVVPEMFNLQKAGWGRDQGEPPACMCRGDCQWLADAQLGDACLCFSVRRHPFDDCHRCFVRRHHCYHWVRHLQPDSNRIRQSKHGLGDRQGPDGGERAGCRTLWVARSVRAA